MSIHPQEKRSRLALRTVPRRRVTSLAIPTPLEPIYEFNARGRSSSAPDPSKSKSAQQARREQAKWHDYMQLVPPSPGLQEQVLAEREPDPFENQSPLASPISSTACLSSTSPTSPTFPASPTSPFQIMYAAEAQIPPTPPRPTVGLGISGIPTSTVSRVTTPTTRSEPGSHERSRRPLPSPGDRNRELSPPTTYGELPPGGERVCQTTISSRSTSGGRTPKPLPAIGKPLPTALPTPRRSASGDRTPMPLPAIGKSPTALPTPRRSGSGDRSPKLFGINRSTPDIHPAPAHRRSSPLHISPPLHCDKPVPPVPGSPPPHPLPPLPSSSPPILPLPSLPASPLTLSFPVPTVPRPLPATPRIRSPTVSGYDVQSQALTTTIRRAKSAKFTRAPDTHAVRNFSSLPRIARKISESDKPIVAPKKAQPWLDVLPETVLIEIFTWSSVESIKAVLANFPPTSDHYLKRALHAILAIDDRTWNEETPSTEWRNKVLECTAFMNGTVHLESACPLKSDQDHRWKTHQHELAAELVDARKRWGKSVRAFAPHNLDFRNRPLSDPESTVQVTRISPFKSAADELLFCQQYHQPEIDFACEVQWRVCCQLSKDNPLGAEEILSARVRSTQFKHMWCLMHSGPPGERFEHTRRTLARLRCMCISDAMMHRLPTDFDRELVNPAPPINLDGTVAWEETWKAMAVLVPLARQSIEDGNDIGHVSGALGTMVSRGGPPGRLPLFRPPSVRQNTSIWDWANVAGIWHIAMAQTPKKEKSPVLQPYGWLKLVPCTIDTIDKALAARWDSEDIPPNAESSFKMGLPYSDALPPIYFNGSTRRIGDTPPFYLRGIVRLTTDQPPELRYRIIFRSFERCTDDLTFEGVQVGGRDSLRGVIGVAFKDVAHQFDLINLPEAKLDEITLPPPSSPCWFWKSEAPADM